MKIAEPTRPRFLSGEDLNCLRIGEETYEFTVDGLPDYRLVVDEKTDLTGIDTDSLSEMDIQMSYNGETDCTCEDEPLCQREAKFSKARKRIREEINRREDHDAVEALLPFILIPRCSESSWVGKGSYSLT